MPTSSSTALVEIAARANLAAYDGEAGARYVSGAPHIKHKSLRGLYAAELVRVFETARRHAPMPRVLDLGAGEGAVTLPVLELGAHVTAVDISSEQLTELTRKCAAHRTRLVVQCANVMDFLGGNDQIFDLIVANSFLHHIPDYLGLLQRLLPRLGPHGQFFSFQDPLLYSTQKRYVRLFDGLSFLLWRIGRQDAWRGLKRRIRRARGIFLPDCAHDNAEYHVLRGGVDQNAIATLYTRAGFHTRIVPYFSTQTAAFQFIGERIGMKNTFAIIAVRGEGG
jgi:SAM-dependent methyltransferase